MSHLKPKNMQVLLRLAESAGEVVTRQDLFDAVWPNEDVSDDALTQRIVELRRIFGDSAQRPQFIETVPKVGYRLLPLPTPLAAQTGEEREDSGRPKARVSGLHLLVSLGAVVAVILASVWYAVGLYNSDGPAPANSVPSIAVLPFVNLSGDPDNEYFADGLTEELIAQLSNVPGLMVIARTSSAYYKGRKIMIAAVARELDVGHVLEGSVRKSGNRVRITAQLIEADSETHLWSESYDREMRDVFAIQDDIARQVVHMLRVELVGGATPVTRKTSPEAFEAFLWGNRYSRSRRFEDLERAIGYYRKAIDLDPGYADAYAALGSTLRIYGRFRVARGTEWEGWMLQARDAMETALELDDKAPEAHALRAVFVRANDPDLAIEYVKRALELSPSNAYGHFVYGHILRDTGRLKEAEPYFRRAVELDPMNANSHSDYATVLWDLGREEEAAAETGKALRLEPKLVQCYRKLGAWAWFGDGRIDLAIGHFEKAYALEPGSSYHAGFLASAWASLGGAEEAQFWLERTLELSGTDTWPWDLTGDAPVRYRSVYGPEYTYYDRILQRNPLSDDGTGTLDWRDAGPGPAAETLARLMKAHPEITMDETLVVDIANIDLVLEFVPALLAAGETRSAERLLRESLDLIQTECVDGLFRRTYYNVCNARSWIYVLLGDKENALAAMQREIEDGGQRPDTSSPRYDFLRGEPRYQQLMQLVEADLGQQLERARASWR